MFIILSAVGMLTLTSQHNIGTNLILSSLLIFICIFVFTLLGAYLREIYYIIKKRYRKIELNRIMLTALTFSIILFLDSNNWPLQGLDSRTVFLIAFALGSCGYTFIDKVYDGSLLRILFKSISLMREAVIVSIKEIDDNNKDNNTKDKDEE